MGAATPRPAGGQTPQKQHAWPLEPDAQPSAASIVLPESAARKVPAKVWRDRFPVNWIRGQLRQLLGTWPDILDSEVEYPETSAHRFSQAAQPVLRTLTNGLEESQEKELLLGFPSAPFILPLAASNADEFLRYASQHPDHVIRLRRSGQGTAAEWTAFPADDPEAYRLTFNLPDKLEEWIAQTEEQRTARTRQVKQALLADIVVYRMHGDDLRTFQLHYQPQGFRQGRNAYRT